MRASGVAALIFAVYSASIFCVGAAAATRKKKAQTGGMNRYRDAWTFIRLLLVGTLTQTGPPQGGPYVRRGLMFLFERKRFAGSHRFLISTSRAWFSPYA